MRGRPGSRSAPPDWSPSLRDSKGSLPISRADADAIARSALADRGVALTPAWRVLPTPDGGEGGPHEFVAETAGNDRRKALLGVYLPKARWIVRVVTFEGDVAERAEEWQVAISDTGEVRRIEHLLPQDRAGAALDEVAARALAQQALRERQGLDVAKGQAREVSARPEKLKARTDWTLTFVDTTIPALPRGEPRVQVRIAGDEVAAMSRFIYVPEEWQREARAAVTRNLVLQILSGLIFGGILVAAAVMGVVAWSRRRYTPRLFLAAMGLVFIASLINAANGWPTALASLQTALPLNLQIIGVMGIGLVALTISSGLVGLAIGALPHRLATSGRLDDGSALRLGVALGLFGAGIGAGAAALRTPSWADAPYVAPLGAFVPWLDLAVDPITGFMMRVAVVLSLFAFVHAVTSGWTRHRAPWAMAILAVGMFAGGPPSGLHLGGWLLAGVLTATALLAAYVTLIRADVSIVVIAVGTIVGVAALARGTARPFPGALAGGGGAVVVMMAVAWWCFSALRKARDAAGVRGA